MAEKESFKMGTPFEVKVLPVLKKTCVPILNYKVTKRIEDISFLEKGKTIVCSSFCLEFNGEWHFEYMKSENNWFSFFLNRHAEQPLLTMEYKVSAHNFAGKEIYRKSSEISYDGSTKSYNLFPTEFKKKPKYPLGMLFVEVNLAIFAAPVSMHVAPPLNKEVLQRKALSALQKNYKDLYTNRKYSDVTLIVKSQGSLSAHKYVLSTGSPVFARMFEQQGMVEQQDSVVSIDDISLLTLNRLVTFLYCGEVEDYDFETAADMYYAADKYDVVELRRYCVFKLVSNLTSLNVGRALTLAEQQCDQDLKDRVFPFLFQRYQ